MIVREVEETEKINYNAHVHHIIQSWEWGDFRKKTGLELVRLGQFNGNTMVSAYQLTLHPVPIFPQVVGYLPKGPMPDAESTKALIEVGRDKNVAFIKIEPNVFAQEDLRQKILTLGYTLSKKSLFTRYNFLLDLTKSEQNLLAAMHPKTRYNIGVAQKKGVEVYESTKDADFEIYLKLYFDTTHRQKYFGHTPDYHRLVWKTLMPAGMARLLIGKYQGIPLVAWMLFNFKETLYYPYGGSSNENREVMASNLVAWEAIRMGKKMGLRVFDMWGALGPDAKDSDPWFGFHRFKAGYGPSHVEYIGTYDLILRQALYKSMNFADRMRWTFLRATRR